KRSCATNRVSRSCSCRSSLASTGKQSRRGQTSRLLYRGAGARVNESRAGGACWVHAAQMSRVARPSRQDGRVAQRQGATPCGSLIGAPGSNAERACHAGWVSSRFDQYFLRSRSLIFVDAVPSDEFFFVLFVIFVAELLRISAELGHKGHKEHEEENRERQT